MLYIKAMFVRHGDIPEDQQLDLVICNLAPFYSMQLPDVNSELENACLKLEVKKF